MEVELLGRAGICAEVLLCVAALVLGPVALLPHLPRRWLALARNLTVVLLSSLLLIVALGLHLNRMNEWYPTLGDALGRPSRIDVVHAGASSTPAAKPPATVTRHDRRTLPALPLPGSRVQSFDVPTSIGHRTWRVNVVLPKDYSTAAAAHKAYPVLMLGHGSPGTPQVWTQKMSIAGLTDQLVHDKKVAPFIAVAPALSPDGMDSECLIGPDDDRQMETWLSHDVPAFIRAHLRAAPERAAWAWAGYSAGGWCSAAMVMLHPDQFAGGIVLGGYFRPWWGQDRPSWEPGSFQARRLDLVNPTGARPDVALYVQTSRRDTQSWPSTNLYLQTVRAPTVVEAEVNATGGHTFALWQPGLQRGVVWLGRTVPGFMPKG